MTIRSMHAFLWVAIGVSILLFCIYVGRGIYLLGFSPARPTDLWLRWCDLQYVSVHQNPYDIGEIFYHPKKASLSLLHAPRVVHINLDLDRGCGGGGYPPWAFFWSNIFIPPIAWNFSHLWFFLVNVGCLGFLARYAWNASPSNNLMHRLFLLFGALGVNAIGTTLGNGQWGLILMVLLILAVRLQGILGGIPSGLLYAITLLKPTVAFTFAVVFLARGRFLLLSVAGLLTIFAAIFIGWRVNTNPLEMVQQLFAQTAIWTHVPYSVQDFLPVLGFSNTVDALGSLGLAFVLSLLLIFKSKGDSLLQMAICGTLARVGPYHQLYDDVMIIFLHQELGRLFLVRPAWSNAFVYMLIAGSLYLPGRLTNYPVVNLIHIVIWSLSLGWLICNYEEDPSGQGKSARGLKSSERRAS